MMLLRQTWLLTQVGLATLPRRLGSASVVVVGIAGVVGVLVALLAMGEGFQSTLKQTGDEVTAIVMRAGARTEINSVLSRTDAALIGQAPQTRKDARGRPIVSEELVVVASLPKRSTGLDANVEVRGIGENSWVLRPHVKIIEGREFRSGLRELVVGKGARDQFMGLDMGGSLSLNNQSWNIVGVFDSGDAHNSEVWGDVQVVGPTYRRGSSITSVSVLLTEAAAFAAFKNALAQEPQLKVEALTTRAYYSQQSEQLARLIRILGTAVGLIMAIGAVFGALNTMHAAVAGRIREIATLRAIGFRGMPVVASVLVETLMLAALGGLLGGAIAWLLFHNYTVSTLGSNFTQVVFAFKVSPALVGSGLVWALIIGFVGGLFPARRAARIPVTAGLREM